MSSGHNVLETKLLYNICFFVVIIMLGIALNPWSVGYASDSNFFAKFAV